MQLLQVYSKEGNQQYKTQDELKQEQKFYKHFLRVDIAGVKYYIIAGYFREICRGSSIT